MTDTQTNPPISDETRVPKGKIIRNRDVDKAARALADEHVLPEVPGSKLSWTQAEEYFKLLTPAMWSHVSVYVYRVKPKIRRQLRDADLPNYIDCLGKPFTIEQFTGWHGGGKYQLRINDNDKKGQQRDARTIFTCDLDIDDVKYPPILEYAELELDARENQTYITWLRSQGILDARGKVVQPGNSTANGGIRDMVDMMRAVKEITSDANSRAHTPSEDDSLSKAVGNILVEQMKQNDPTKQVQATASLVQNVKEMMDSGKSDSGIAKIYELLITMTTEQRKADTEARAEQSRRDSEQRARDMEMIKMLLEAHKPAPDADIDKLTKMYSLAEQIFGSRPSGRRSGWDIGYDLARDVALPAISSIGSIFTNIMALRRGGAPVAAPGAPAPAPAPVAFDPYRDTAAAAAYAASIRNQTPPPAPAPAPTPAAAAPPPTTQAPPAAGAAPPNAQVFEIFQNYGQLVLNAINNGTPGWIFADNLVGLLGTATHAMISQHGETALVAAMKSIPEFTVFGDARLNTFVHEFINFEEYGDDAETDDEDEEIKEIPPAQIDISQPYKPRERAARR